MRSTPRDCPKQSLGVDNLNVDKRPRDCFGGARTPPRNDGDRQEPRMAMRSFLSYLISSIYAWINKKDNFILCDPVRTRLPKQSLGVDTLNVDKRPRDCFGGARTPPRNDGERQETLTCNDGDSQEPRLAMTGDILFYSTSSQYFAVKAQH